MINTECKLCLKNRKLAQSHIIPEFFYRPLKKSILKNQPDNKHFVLVSVDEKPRALQTGIFERLLCEECEGKLQKYETYVSNILQFGGKNTIISKHPNHIQIAGIQYDKFKLFQMSLLWRAGVCSRPEFEEVSLGIQHSEKMRLMLLDSNPGISNEYGCILAIPKGANSRNEAAIKIVQQGIMPPIKTKVMDCRAYIFAISGLLWIYIVDKRSAKIGKGFFLMENGSLPIFTDKIFWNMF